MKMGRSISCAVCIPTFKRPESLVLAITSLLGHVSHIDEVLIGITGPQAASISPRVEALFTHAEGALRLAGIDVIVKDELEGLLFAKEWFKKTACSDVLLFLDDDAVVGEGYFDLLDHFRDTGIAAVSGVLQTPVNTADYEDWGATTVPWSGPDCNPVIFTETSVEFPNKKQVFMHDDARIYECEYLLGTALFIRKSLLELDFGFQRGVCAGEEADFTHKLYREGYRLLFDPSRVAWHFHATTGGMREFSNNMKVEETFGYFRQKWGPSDEA